MSDFAITATPIYLIDDLTWGLAIISKDLPLDQYRQKDEYFKIKNIIRLTSWYRGNEILIEQVTLLYMHWKNSTNSLDEFNQLVKEQLKHINKMARRFPLQMETLYLTLNK